MGLIGNIFQPLYLGIPSIFMSPVSFLQKPFRWLQAISNYKATTTGSPNFSYALCSRRINYEQLLEFSKKTFPLWYIILKCFPKILTNSLMA